MSFPSLHVEQVKWSGAMGYIEYLTFRPNSQQLGQFVWWNIPNDCTEEMGFGAATAAAGRCWPYYGEILDVFQTSYAALMASITFSLFLEHI